MLLPALRAVATDVVDVHLPALGGLHRFAFVALRKQFAFQARQVAAALWGTNALARVKFLVLVDDDVDVHDVPRVLDRVGANVAPERDVFSFDGPAYGNETAGHDNAMSRHLALDATAKWPGEQSSASPGALDAGEAIRQHVTARWAEYQIESSRLVRA